MRLLGSKRHGPRGAGCRRHDFENKFAAGETDFSSWSWRGAVNRRRGGVQSSHSRDTTMRSNIDHSFLLLVLELDALCKRNTFSEW